MTSKEKIELIEGFKAIDKNGDGKLSKSELTECT
jgi:calcium-dependent protein kinase